jgi:hypothetical protein
MCGILKRRTYSNRNGTLPKKLLGFNLKKDVCEEMKNEISARLSRHFGWWNHVSKIRRVVLLGELEVNHPSNKNTKKLTISNLCGIHAATI